MCNIILFYYSTDLPVILSGEYCAFLEPHKEIWSGKPGCRYTLRNLQQSVNNVLEIFHGIAGFSSSMPIFKGQTMFRFPLRNIRSKLSNEVYSVERITKLLQCLKDEAELLLLFLRSVQSIEVFVISETGSLSTLFKVIIESANTHNMTSIGQRVKFFDEVESSFQAGSIANTLNCTLLFSIAVINDIQLNEKSKSQMYVVVHHVGSADSEVLQCAENFLSVKNHQVIPWVSLAYKVNDVTGNPEGRLFCFLPLPTEEQAPFALHVNATFATSSNRRSVVWVAKERQNDEGRWNGLLVEKCLPSCYVHLLNVLVQLEIHPEIVYKCWPDISKLQHTPWQGMLKPFFTQLLQMSTIFHTPVFGGQWISLKESILVAKDRTSLQNALKQFFVPLISKFASFHLLFGRLLILIFPK